MVILGRGPAIGPGIALILATTLAGPAAAEDPLPDLVVGRGSAAGCDAVDRSTVGTGEPATCSLQVALDFLQEHGDPSPGDGRVVVALQPGDAGLPMAVTISGNRRETLEIQGHGARLQPAEPTRPILTLDGRAGDVVITGLTFADASPAIRITDPAATVTLSRLRFSRCAPGIEVEAANPSRGRLRVVDTEIRQAPAPHPALDVVTTATAKLELSLEGVEVGAVGGLALSAQALGSSQLDTTVRRCTFSDAPREGLGGSNGVSLTASDQAHHRLRVLDTTLDRVQTARGNAGALTVAAFGAATVEATIAATTIRSVADAQGVRLISEASGGGRFDATVEDVTLDGIGRQALVVSARGATREMRVSLVDNLVGVGAPVGTTDRRGLEVAAEDTARLEVVVRGNRVVAHSRRPAVDVTARDGARVHAIVGGPQSENGNELVNLGTDPQAVAFKAAANGDLAEVCLEVEANRARAAGPAWRLDPAEGALRVVDLDRLETTNDGVFAVAPGVEATASCR